MLIPVGGSQIAARTALQMPEDFKVFPKRPSERRGHAGLGLLSPGLVLVSDKLGRLGQVCARSLWAAPLHGR